jgi:hypothetical protein
VFWPLDTWYFFFPGIYLGSKKPDNLPSASAVRLGSFIYRTRAGPGMGSTCGPGASPPPGPRESARDVPRVRKYRRAARLSSDCNGARWSTRSLRRSSTAVTTGFVRGHRAPVTTNNPRLHRDPQHRCTRVCKRSNLPPARCQVQSSLLKAPTTNSNHHYNRSKQ